MAITLRAGGDDGGRRLDRLLRKALPELPLSALHRLLRQGRVLVDGRRAGPEERVGAGALISLPELPGLSPRRETPPRPFPGGTALPPILFEGEGLLILNKPAGLIVHGKDSLETLVRSRLAPQLAPSLSFRPGPLHRLDRPTSGIIVFSESLEGARRFSALLRQGALKKYYLALVEGRLEGPQTWEDGLYRDRGARKTFAGDLPHSGETPQAALTRVSPLAWTGDSTLLLAELGTGRTHQIRAQAAARGHPLAGDRKYGAYPRPGGFLLHAWKLEFSGDQEGLSIPPRITAPLPEVFQARIRELFGEKFTGELLRS